MVLLECTRHVYLSDHMSKWGICYVLSVTVQIQPSTLIFTAGLEISGSTMIKILWQ